MPEGVADLLGRLETAGAYVHLHVWERDGLVYCVMTDETESKLVACLVGRDRRFIAAP